MGWLKNWNAKQEAKTQHRLNKYAEAKEKDKLRMAYGEIITMKILVRELDLYLNRGWELMSTSSADSPGVVYAIISISRAKLQERYDG